MLTSLLPRHAVGNSLHLLRGRQRGLGQSQGQLGLVFAAAALGVPAHGADKVTVRGFCVRSLVPDGVVREVLVVVKQRRVEQQPHGVLPGRQAVHGLAGTLALASVHDRAHAHGRAFGVQVELARVQRGQVAPAQQRPDEPGLGPGDALHLLGEVAEVVGVAGQRAVEAGPHGLGHLGRQHHLLGLVVLLAERGELALQVADRRHVRRAALG